MVAATAGMTWANVSTATPSESVIYSFSTTDGANPSALARGKNGNFYGTAAVGGTNNLGTLFELTHEGVLTTLHSFAGTDGASPNSIIEGPDGNFYGTTMKGGTANRGTIFKLKPTGALTTLHSFSGTDGAAPNPLIFGWDGRLYGTTASGGSTGSGVIFAIACVGAFTTLYDFSGPDGRQPGGALLEATDGFFYGVTSAGGDEEFGTVFKISSTGALTTLILNSLEIGGEPIGALVQGTDGNFYGVTTAGYGEVYQMTPSGKATQLYVFNPNIRPSDGAGFQTGLIMDFAGDLYGTNTFGGEFNYGALFRITMAGVLTRLRAFAPGSDGALFGTLIEGQHGPLYGVGSLGGPSGVGVVEEFSRWPVPPTLTFSISPTSLNVGQTAQATWFPTDSDTCTASGAWTGSKGIAQYNAVTLEFAKAGEFTYKLKCEGAGRSVSQNVTVTVTGSPVSHKALAPRTF
jgi:uncharacterized repeat protein (TIGR03803 family)